QEYDLAGAATGVVEHARLLGPHRVRPGDAVVALASSGLHANGYSLVRAVLRTARWSLDRHVPDLGRTLGEELLEPTRVYAADLRALIRAEGLDVHALSHVTGGGLAANLARVLPPGVLATLDRASWTPAPVFDLVRQLGQVPVPDLERTLNLGVGFVVVLPATQTDRAVEICRARGIPAWLLGEVSARAPQVDVDVTRGAKGVQGGSVQLVGSHPA
ncbi:MAG TPA: AIR synthase-related protein, partial [Dermatophilaceae bacterium]|nr:AIR synthase-related protein [Dermatophilaceae bacterium]